MKLYKLKFELTRPDLEGEKPYLAKATQIPGCRAWGDTASQAPENLQSVAAAFLEP